LCQVDAASGDIAFAEIFAGEHEVGINRKRLVIIGDADFKTAGLAVALARVIQHAGVILILNCGQNLQSPLILTRFGQHAALFDHRVWEFAELTDFTGAFQRWTTDE
jgi:hypothetical protein